MNKLIHVRRNKRQRQSTMMKSSTLLSPHLLALPLLTTSQIITDIPLSSCPPGQQWSYSLTTDDYPWETSWELTRITSTSSYVASGPEDGVYGRRADYDNTYCLESGNYKLILRDAMGDGFCCNFGEGQWTMMVGGDVVGSKGGGRFKSLEMDFTVGDGDDNNDSNSDSENDNSGFSWQPAVQEEDTMQTIIITQNPTNRPTTNKPTPQPTPKPTSKPTPSPTPKPSSTQITLNTQSNISNSPTTSPTTDPWLTFNPRRHFKYCGPKIVGGFAIAVQTCGPLTMCGLVTTSDHYGSNGNDCPKGLMCFNDIVCENTRPGDGMRGRGEVDGEYEMELEEGLEEERVNGGIKVNEVSLKQDLEKSRVEGEESDREDVVMNAAMMEDVYNSAAQLTTRLLSFAIVLSALLLV